MQSSDTSLLLTSAMVSLAFGLPRTRALLLRASYRAHANARRFGDGSPAPPRHRISSRRNEALPGCWIVLITRAASQTPRQMCVALAMTIDATVAFGAYGTLGIRYMFYFRGHHAAAHALACLRIADAVAGHRRKACFRVTRLGLLGRNLASAGRRTEISEALSHAPPSQTNVAWSLP